MPFIKIVASNSIGRKNIKYHLSTTLYSDSRLDMILNTKPRVSRLPSPLVHRASKETILLRFAWRLKIFYVILLFQGLRILRILEGDLFEVLDSVS